MVSDDNAVPVGSERPLPEGRFGGRLEFEALVLSALQKAACEGWPMLILSDPDFSDWPLNQRAVIESLNTWAVAGRKLTIFANRYEVIQHRQPRFVAWRRTWDHLIDARVCDEPMHGDVPSAIWSPSWCLWRTDLVRHAGFCGTDRATHVNLKETLAERLRTSVSGFSASVLGL